VILSLLFFLHRQRKESVSSVDSTFTPEEQVKAGLLSASVR